MPKIDQATKAERKERVFLTLRRYPLGLKVMELTEITGFERRTLDNYLLELEREGKVYKEDRSALWVALPWEQTQLRKFELSPEEAMTLYLAARLFTKQHDKRNEPAETALMKLATALTSDAKIGHEIHQAALELAQRPDAGEYNQVFRAVMQAYIYRRVLHITYEPGQGRAFETDFSPFLLEPSAVGFTTYAIGHSSLVNAWRTYKLERIRAATLTRQEYRIPPDFPGLDILRSAWSIIWGEEVETVVLRFSPSVYRRVMETRWHPSETKAPDPDKPGYLRWSAQVADTLDMLPWVRGWGADVEVLEPEELRKEVIQHVVDLAIQYRAMTLETKPYAILWAKADKKDQGKIHRLVYHLIDVGQVTLAMWKQAIDAESKRQFCRWLDCDEETAGRTLAFLISLHDLGKASPAFQIKVKTMQNEISKAGFWLPVIKPPRASPHGVVTTWASKDILQETLNASKKDAKALAQALGGHHGAWPIPVDWQTPQMTSDDTGEKYPLWNTARKELVEAMREIFNPASALKLPQEQELNAFLTVFSGFASVADWIGSMTEYFSYEKSVNIPLQEYTARAASNAEKALSDLGWFNWRADGTMLTFKEMFPLIAAPNSIQQKIVDEAGKTQLPALLILESPTGSGKTEAALYAADTWLQAQRGSGLYIAMPTQATSNQMYERVTKFLRQRYPEETLNLHLVHGGALLEDKKPVEAQGISDDDDQNNAEGGIRAEAWFLPRKRTLLAPFGVGTVDQTLMSVLQTRHFFVRMFGLQNKVVVFDEVHAYDTYMSELFKRLLAWLRQIGVSVILLSATLPEQTRRDLTAAYLGPDEVDVPPAEYPRLTIASAAGVQSISLETPSSRTVQLKQCDADPKTIIENLRAAVLQGGCAAVICNRVARAQELYKEIQAAGLVPAEDLILFHARFPFVWREEIEREVLGKFGKGENGGKNPNRPKKSIVVATQVIEQSLDLDFDFMISDLAPMDLLIQRAGRLHRHSQNDPDRPETLKTPALLIAFPQAGDIPEFGHDEFVYERLVMLKTWLALKDKTEITLPRDTTPLIEAVYGGEVEARDEALQKQLADAAEKMEQHERTDVYNATLQLIYPPDSDSLLSQRNNNLDEDDPTIHKAFRAMTRSADPSVTLICLHRVNGALHLDPEDGANPLETSAKPDKEMVRELLRRSVSVQNRTVVNHYTSREPELAWKGWKEVAALKYAIPIVFEEGRCKLENTKYALVLDRLTGLTIQKEEQ